MTVKTAAMSKRNMIVPMPVLSTRAFIGASIYHIKLSAFIEGFFMVLQNFIVFEGIDGAGTTTQLNALRNRKDTGNFLFTAEPTTAPTGKFLRQMLKGDIPLTPVTSAYLFAADRTEHVFGNLVIGDGGTLVTGIEKACAQNKIVVIDRYFFSSLAYQSIDCGKETPRILNS